MILLTVTHTMESILQQLTEMDVIQAEKNFWLWELRQE